MVTAPTPRSLPAPALAAADLDGDGRADFVFSTGLALSGSSPSTAMPCGESAYACVRTGVRWNSAAAGDFNRDGAVDVAGWQSTDATGPPAQASIDLLLNAGHGAFNPSVVGTEGPVLGLPPLQGDFDGDLFPDLALAVSVSSATAPEIQLLFGAPSEPLGASAELTGIGNLLDQVSAELGNDVDAASDMTLLTEQTNLELTTFSGDSSRVPISALSLSTSGSGLPEYEARVVRAGRFGGDGHEDVAVISTRAAQGPGGRGMNAQQGRAFVHLVQLDAQARPTESDVLSGDAASLAVELGSSSFVATVSAVAVADADADGTDEVIFVEGNTDQSLVRTFVPKPDRFALTTEFTIQFPLTTTPARGRPGDLPIAAALVADVDADGAEDVTVTTSDGLIVLHGSKDGLPAGTVTHLMLPSADSAVFAWANLDSDPTLELVRASSAGLERFDVDHWDTDLAPRAKVIDVAGDTLSAPASPAALVAGDVTGDGIDDLVLAAAGLRLYRGQAVLR